MPNQIHSKAQNAMIHAAAEGKSDKMSASTAKKMLKDNHPKVSKLPSYVKQHGKKKE